MEFVDSRHEVSSIVVEVSRDQRTKICLWYAVQGGVRACAAFISKSVVSSKDRLAQSSLVLNRQWSPNGT